MKIHTHRPSRAEDFRPLAGLLAQPLAAVNGSSCRQPVWHELCAPLPRTRSCLTRSGRGSPRTS